MPRAPKVGTLFFVAWSFSRLLLWERCPRRAYFKFLKKEEEPATGPTAHGDDVHKIAEAFIENPDPKAKCPDELYCFEEEFATVRKIPRARRGTEVNWAFDKNWKPCSGTDWKNCWLRFRADLTWDAPLVRNVVDFKTGKKHDYNEAQARLGGLCALLTPPFRKSAKSNLWYLEQGEDQPITLLATQIEEEKKYWEKRVAPMLADRDFLPKPEYMQCKYCPYSRKAAEGRLCPHG